MSFSLRRMLRERPFWILLAAVTAFFWRPLTGETFFFRDLYLLFLGKKQFLADAVRAGVVPLWDPLIHGGQPFLAEPANSVFYPSNVLFLIVPALTALNLHLVLQFVLCAATMYFLVRAVGLSPAAAFGGGAVYALCGYVLSAANLMVLMQSLPWPPALLACAILFLREKRKRWLVGAAIAGALPLLAGAAEMAAMSLVITAAWCLVVPTEVSLRRRVAVVLAIVAFSAGLSLVQTVPAYEVIRNSLRSEGLSYTAFAQWSVHRNRLPELIVPRFFGPTDRLARDDYWGARYELGFPYIISIYFGAVTLLLAVAGACSAASPLSRRSRLLFSTFVVVAICLSIGGYLPFFRFLYEHVPLISIFRFPVKALQLTLVPVALLAACGLDAFTAMRKRLIPAAAILLALLGLAVIFQSSLAPSLFGRGLSPAEADQLRLSLMHPVGALAVLIVLAVIGGRRNVTGAIAGLVLVDLAVAGAHVNAYATRELFAPPPLAAKVKALLGPGEKLYRTPDPFMQRLRTPSNENVWLAWWDYQLLRRYTAATFGIPVVFHDDFDGLAPLRIRRMTDALTSMAPAQRLSVLAAAGASVLLTPDELPAAAVTLVERLRGADGGPLFLYRHRGARGVRLATAADVIADDVAAFRTLATRPFDPRRVILSESTTDTPVCPPHAGIEPRTLERTINTWSVEVVSPCAGYVVFAETHYPGWTASVDGRNAPVIRADVAFSAVPVPAGRHVVVKRYRPRWPWVGFLGSLASAILLVFWRVPAVESARSGTEFTFPSSG